MEEKETVKFEEVLESEADDILDIFFPYMAEKKEKLKKVEPTQQSKTRRHLKFLTMSL
ncbi:MAG: hypothetical protein FWC13_09060 [Oscillospiraceae bacterium]|nr:hypothetical protein [Oscillospiraceae bacterium]